MSSRRLSFALIGGGPSAFYMAKLLSRLPQKPIIHIYERELCPFGLLRHGVAPDHIAIKKAEVSLSSVSTYDSFGYMGGQQVNWNTLQTMKQIYSGVILATGAFGELIPNEIKSFWPRSGQMKHIYHAKDIVSWYNQNPSHETFQLSIQNVRDVAIVGNGNVAIDIARIFTASRAHLAQSEIPLKILTILNDCRIRTVSIVGRRGVVQSAFALKELRELKHLGIELYAVEEELELSLNEQSAFQCTAIGHHLANVVRMNKRKVDFIRESFRIIPLSQVNQVVAKQTPKIIFRYLLTPSSFSSDHRCLKLARTNLEGEAFQQIAINTTDFQQIRADMFVLSTGFAIQQNNPYHRSQERLSNQLNVQTTQDSPLPCLPNSNGCLQLSPQQLDPTCYAVGWSKTGSKGVLDQTFLSCEETFNNLRRRVEGKFAINSQEELKGPITESQPKTQTFHPLLKLESLPLDFFSQWNGISFNDYASVRNEELRRGNGEKWIKRRMSSAEIKQWICKNHSQKATN